MPSILSCVLTALTALTALTFPAFADTLMMKDGSTVEGTILRQDATSYVVEVQVTKSIKDERVIAKADVIRVKTEGPDEAAFESIAGLVPTPDALTTGQYAQRIKRVEKFMSDYRDSWSSIKAKKILATLKSEADEVRAGGIKLNGKLMTSSEYQANAYEIDSGIEAARIKRLIDQGRNLMALRAFAEFERDFRNTPAYQELVPQLTRVIRTYLAGTGQLLATFDSRTKERQAGLERMPAADQIQTTKAIAAENVAIQKRFDSERSAKLDWVTPHPFFKPSLEDAVRFGKQELARLADQSATPTVDGGKAYRDAMALIQSSEADETSVTAAIHAAKTAGVAQRYLHILESAAKSGGF